MVGNPDEDATLVFSDNGVGFIDPGNSKRHGLGLVRRLMEQVEGSVALRSDHGTVWTMKFSVPAIPSVNALTLDWLGCDSDGCWRSFVAKLPI
jgi:two-component sensor histidine kinase